MFYHLLRRFNSGMYMVVNSHRSPQAQAWHAYARGLGRALGRMHVEPPRQLQVQFWKGYSIQEPAANAAEAGSEEVLPSIGAGGVVAWPERPLGHFPDCLGEVLPSS